MNGRAAAGPCIFEASAALRHLGMTVLDMRDDLSW